MPFDHLFLIVKDLDKSAELYSAALAPLGYTERTRYEGVAVGFGTTDKQQDFWLGTGKKITKGVHVAFIAESKEVVEAFHAAAIEAGAKDHGKPGYRELYGTDYYAAFFLDADGTNVEAVYKGPTNDP